ncbi:MAG: hypothetical protein KAV70_02235 [Bacteroidales bacterium]|nr:hypothetical protein [Bacteroidales bacterium]MCK4360538.1 hypothetical protein [Bacteroidales bacterium]
MDENIESFKQNLDQLIKLFKKLKDRTSVNDIPGIDKMMYQNFDMFLNNYEMMRDRLSDELLSQFGEPIRIIIADLVKRLKEELGENEHIEEKQEIINDIEKIDELLKNPNLSEEETNRLLDERKVISKSKNQEIK